MKKLFTLILMALAIVTGAKAQATEDIDISSGWGWGYNATTTYEEGVMTITLTDGYGGGSIGWGSGVDWSRYNKLTVVIDSYNNDWGKVSFVSTEKVPGGGEYDYVEIASQTFTTINSQTEVVVNFDPTKATSVRQLSIQGKAADDVIKVSRVYLTEAVSYEEKELTLTDNVHILSSEFDAYDDANEVKLTIANNSGASRDGWGIGEITNIDNWNGDDAPADNYRFSLTGKTGTEFTIFTTVGELKKVAKNNGDDYIVSRYNRTGVSFSVYNGCSLVKATVLVPQSDSPSFSAVTISSTLSGTNENIPVVANGEELFADLSDEATNDFVINSITITPVGSFQSVQGQFRLTSEDGSTQILPQSGFKTVSFTYDSTDDVWKAENLKLEVAGSDLDANTNYILEFYFEGSTDGTTYDYTYKNGENNFKVKFQNGIPPVQFKAENTATMTLNVDGTATTINFNKDGSVYNNGNDDLGEVSVLSITGFTTTVISSVAASSNLECWITKADGSASTQVQSGMYTEDVNTNGDEQSLTATVTNTNIISITDDEIGLTDGETYILHGYFQVKDNNGKHYFAPNKDNGESFAIQFTYKETPTGINGISTDEADENEETYNIAGQKVGKGYKGIVIKNGKKQIVK